MNLPIFAFFSSVDFYSEKENLYIDKVDNRYSSSKNVDFGNWYQFNWNIIKTTIVLF